ncbi:MAG: VanZ family protein [Chloroflexi bacterium]|nr:VanZ family protein [Chloroflexota bacterium]
MRFAAVQRTVRPGVQLLWRVGPAVAWAGAIFWLSSQPDLPRVDLTLLDLLWKKGAHAAGYAVFALLVQRALDPSWRQPRGRLLAWLLAVAYAASDEWHQAFVPGRTATPIDVAIDAAGAALGLRLWAHAQSRSRPWPAERLFQRWRRPWQGLPPPY